MKTITIKIGAEQLILDENWNTTDGKHYLGWVQKHYNDSFNYGVEFGDIIVTDSGGRRLTASGWKLEWATDLMYVDGVYTGHLNDGTMEWVCPLTNETKVAWGQFEVVDDEFQHTVTDENNNVLYVVIGREVKS
jgi:hypothetical protein